jgi:hypothetical protein
MKEQPDDCTTACTNSCQTGQLDPVQALAVLLLSLSPSDRIKLAQQLRLLAHEKP